MESYVERLETLYEAEVHTVKQNLSDTQAQASALENQYFQLQSYNTL